MAMKSSLPCQKPDWHTTIDRPPLDAAPIKRLGKPGFWHGKEDFIAMMTVAYRGVTEAALNAAFKGGTSEK